MTALDLGHAFSNTIGTGSLLVAIPVAMVAGLV